MIKVSIIVPVYNAEKYLSKCLDSLITQTLKKIEIICINDGSTDHSLSILKEYAKKDSRIKVINQKNKGVEASRNIGIEKALGKYIGFIDSDDYISENYYEKLYHSALKNDADIAMTSRVCVFSDEGKFLKNMGAHSGILSSIPEKGKVIISTGAMWNKLYSKNFIKKIKLKHVKICSVNEDNYWTALSIIQANKISVIDNVTYFYRHNPTSLVHKGKAEKDFKMIQVYQAIFNAISSIKIPLSEKEQWFNIVNARMWRDKFTFLNELPSRLKDKFQRGSQGTGFPVIVSLTSYPARINTVHQTIYSLLNQTVKPDKVILWLAPEQFPCKEKDLPKELLDLIPKGLSIDWYHDIRSYKKLIPTLKKYPEALIITVDDDAIYPNNTLEKLINSYTKEPSMIHALIAHKITFQGGEIAPYLRWRGSVQLTAPSYNNFPTGVGGILYPPHSLHPDIFNEEKFMTLSPHGDDIWFWAMAVHQGTKINLIPNQGNSYITIPESQQTCLWHINVSEGQNDIQIAAVLRAYPDILAKLDKSNQLQTNHDIKLSLTLFEYKNIPDILKLKIAGIPIFALKHKEQRNTRKLSVLGIPLFKIQDNRKATLKKVYFLGVPVWIQRKI